MRSQRMDDKCPLTWYIRLHIWSYVVQHASFRDKKKRRNNAEVFGGLSRSIGLIPLWSGKFRNFPLIDSSL